MTTNHQPGTTPPRRHPKLARTLAIAGVVACIVFGVFFVAILYAREHAEPIVRARIIHTLEERLHAHVQLDHVSVSVITGEVHVGASGLRITSEFGHPLLAARAFEFSTGLRNILGKKSTPVTVRVQGLDIHIPAGPEREATTANVRNSLRKSATQGMFSIVEVLATDSTLTIDRLDPTRAPLVFQIGKLRFVQSNPGEPFTYDAQLINPKPIGDIHSMGQFGPWNGQIPRNTPIAGNFTFTNADLSTINGIRGHLQGQGTIDGTIGEIVTDGATHIPDFGLDTGTTSVRLDATFHAIVDGTTGDVNLQPVNARLLNTVIFCSGKVVRIQGDDRIVHGHDIALDTNIRGRVEDILILLSKGKAPMLRAAFTDRGRLHIPPGKQRVITRIDTSGNATLSGVVWTDSDAQQKVNSLSMRATGNAKELARVTNDHDPTTNPPAVTSTINTQFRLANGALKLTGLTYTMPGATVKMDGTFNIPADSLDFHGQVRTVASPSQMITGWKSMLLKPFDPLFKRNGAGLQLPISLTGSPSKPHVGLDLGKHKDSTPNNK